MTRFPESLTALKSHVRRMLMYAFLVAAALPLAAQAPIAQTATLPGHVVGSLANATLIPHTSQMDEEQIRLTVVLNLSDPAGAKALEQEMADPDSPNYRRAISASEFRARFGPTQEAYESVLVYLEQNGLSLSHGSTSRRTLTVRGTRAQAQKAFHVAIDDYKLGDRTFHAVASDPAVPQTIAPLIASIFGLNNLARPVPASGLSPATPASIATAYNGSLTPWGKPNTHGLPPGLDGSGQLIGLIEFDGFDPNDVANWLDFAGLPANLIDNVSVVPIDGGTSPSGCTQSEPHCGTTEVLLDIEAAMGIAPGAQIQVLEASQGTDAADVFDQVFETLDSEIGTRAVLSTSWYQCESDIGESEATSLDGIISDFQSVGITVFAATGDHGGTCVDADGNSFPGTISSPADSSHLVAVGGTTLDVGPENSYDTESWWKDSGGFGVSQYLGEPSYQVALYPGATGRSVPDMSMEAGNGIVVCQASESPSPSCGSTPKSAGIFVGTSLATPLMAATWALANQAAGDAGVGGELGAVGGGLLYQWPHGFHAASTMTGKGNDFKHVGLGSPDMTNLIAKVVTPRIDSYSPEFGPATAGTTVTILGAGFIGVEKVTFGGVDATHLKVYSDKKLTVKAPEAPSEEVSVKVHTPGGWATAAALYTYNPEITKVSPSSGYKGGGTTVTVTGRALSTSEIFVFGEARATDVACPSSNKCTMVSPANAVGTVPVVAETVWGYGYSPITSATQFTYELFVKKPFNN